LKRDIIKVALHYH